MKQTTLFILLIGFISFSCKRDEPIHIPDKGIDKNYNPTPYQLQIPSGLAKMPIPDNNPLTEEGVSLGRKLFYDPILSKGNKQSCASCHNQEYGFTDNGLKLSVGVDKIKGDKNAMAIINLGWDKKFFWDGRSPSLEKQAFDPVTNPVEMNTTWPKVVAKLNAHTEYPDLFFAAFGQDSIDSNQVSMALAQFERILVSGNSKYDQAAAAKAVFTPEEQLGQQIFNSEKGDCMHCHATPFFSTFDFHNNGLQKDMVDLGLGAVTKDPNDNGKFKVPTLRNIALTAPYMHDGRFETLEEVVDFYNDSVNQKSPNINPVMNKTNRFNGSLGLTDVEKKALVAFLKTLTDEEFINNEAFSDPNK